VRGVSLVAHHQAGETGDVFRRVAIVEDQDDLVRVVDARLGRLATETGGSLAGQTVRQQRGDPRLVDLGEAARGLARTNQNVGWLHGGGAGPGNHADQG